jgi:DNA-binding LytR/AlgR family response regulator
MQSAGLHSNKRMKQVLVVEDNPATSNMLCRLLQSCHKNLYIFQAAEVAEAYRIAMNHNIELMLVDLMLDKAHPEQVEGMDFVADMRSVDRYAFVPIIIVSALIDEKYHLFHELHCYGVLEKPFSSENAIHLMRDALKFKIQKKEKRYLYFKQGSILYPIRLTDIVYIEHKRRKMLIHTRNEMIQVPYQTTSRTMMQVEDCGFEICARGLIVNLRYVKALDKVNRYVVLKDGYGRLELGRNYMKRMKDTLQQM